MHKSRFNQSTKTPIPSVSSSPIRPSSVPFYAVAAYKIGYQLCKQHSNKNDEVADGSAGAIVLLLRCHCTTIMIKITDNRFVAQLFADELWG